MLVTTTTDILFCFLFLDNLKLDISCELPTRQMICMQCHALFLQKSFRMLSATNLNGTIPFTTLWIDSSDNKLVIFFLENRI